MQAHAHGKINRPKLASLLSVQDHLNSIRCVNVCTGSQSVCNNPGTFVKKNNMQHNYHVKNFTLIPHIYIIVFSTEFKHFHSGLILLKTLLLWLSATVADIVIAIASSFLQAHLYQLPHIPINSAGNKKAGGPNWFIRQSLPPHHSGIIKVWGYFLN